MVIELKTKFRPPNCSVFFCYRILSEQVGGRLKRSDSQRRFIDITAPFSKI